MNHQIRSSKVICYPHRRLGARLGARLALYDKDNVQLELYGLLEVGLGYLKHSYDASDVLVSSLDSYHLKSSPHSFTGLYNAGVTPSRFGLQGAVQFASGQQVFFRLESGFNVTGGVLTNNGQSIYNNIIRLHTANGGGSVNGQALGRAAYVGASDPTWGSLELGRTYNLASIQTVQYDPLQGAVLYSPIGEAGAIGGGLGTTENTRLDESLRYENTVAHFKFGAQYKFAGDKGAQSAGSGWVGMLAFTRGGFSIEGTFSEMTNTVTWPTQYSQPTGIHPAVS